MATLNETLTILANNIRNKAGITGQLGLEDMITAVKGLQVGGGGALVDEAIKVVDPITTHTPVYTNEKLLGHLTPTSRYVALWLPVNVPLVTTNHTYAIVACPTYLYGNMVAIRNRNDALMGEIMADLVVIQKGMVHVGSLSSNVPIAPGTYRLVIFE